MTQPIIRIAKQEDADEICRLYRQLSNSSDICVLPEKIKDFKKDANNVLLVVEINKQICGTALVIICPDVMFKSQPFAVIENLIVNNDKRNKGIGTALFKYIERYCWDKDCSKIMLLSSKERENAHVFFKKFGFDESLKKGFVKYRSSMT